MVTLWTGMVQNLDNAIFPLNIENIVPIKDNKISLPRHMEQ